MNHTSQVAPSRRRKTPPTLDGKSIFHSPPPPNLSGREVLEGKDEALKRLILEETMAIAEKAREDVCTFFEFVMRRIDTPDPIKLAPHQRVALEFIQAHDRCVLMFPVGASKSFLCTGLTLWMLGRDHTMRGAIVSATESQASGTLLLVRNYIERSAELKLVFPHLVRSRTPDQWSDRAIVLERPRGIRDPSCAAYGIDSKSVLGKRLNWEIIDDILNEENTYTPDAREKLMTLIDDKILSRLDPAPMVTKCIAVNTPWHSDDAIHRLNKKFGWAMLRMDALGDVEIRDGNETLIPSHPRYRKFFDSPHLRPAYANSFPGQDLRNDTCRLVAHDPDPSNSVPLWPERMDTPFLEEKRRVTGIFSFNRNFRCLCQDDEHRMCKQSFVNLSLELARELHAYELVTHYNGPNPVFCGVDLAFSPKDKSDDNALFTFEARPNGINVILDLEIGKWDATVTMDKCFDKYQKYGAIVVVESNSAQRMLQSFIRQRDRSAPIKFRDTDRGKAHPEHGVPGFFAEMSNKAWAFPNSYERGISPLVQKLIDGCLEYVPDKHVPDILMAMYHAREQKREWFGATGKASSVDPNAPGPGTVTMQR